jgi:hypothetical protein
MKPFEIQIKTIDNGWILKTWTEALISPRVETNAYLDINALLMDLRGLLK